MEKTVFTNGCFDILHPGHIDLLTKARNLGTKLVVGINSDESVRKIKGAARPFVDQNSRREVLLGLKSVDEVVIFDEPTPENLIKKINPDVLVKGGDWKLSEIIGGDFVLKNGGEVFSLPIKEGFSTTKIAEKIKAENEASVNDSKSNSNSAASAADRKDDESKIRAMLKDYAELFETIAENDSANIKECADLIFETLRKGNKCLICGDGANTALISCSVSEFAERCEKRRGSVSVIVPTADSSDSFSFSSSACSGTASKSNYDFEEIFSKQIEMLAGKGDLLIAVGTSETMPDLIAAVMKARRAGCKILGITGEKGRKLASLSDACIIIPSAVPEQIQAACLITAHIWHKLTDKKIATS